MNAQDELIQANSHLIIYHAISPGVACDDGFGAAWTAISVLKNTGAKIILQEGIYGKIPDYSKINSNTIVHILDFSYPVEILNVIAARAKKVILLDHHKTAEERWEKEKFNYAFNTRDYILFDQLHSGTMLSWMYYFGIEALRDLSKAPKLIQYIQDNDLWKFSLPDTKEFIKALRSYPQDLEVWNRIATRVDFNLPGFIAEGTIINRYYQQKLKEVIFTTKENCRIIGQKGFCCNAPKMFASDIGHILATESGTFGATWFKKADGTIEWSLRCNDGFDVSKIAEQFGGGGHTKAAGFSLSNSDITTAGIIRWSIDTTDATEKMEK